MEAVNLNRHAWRTGTLRFQGTPLPQVVKTICNNYGYKIDLADDCDFPVSGTFATDNPLSVLETLAALGGGELVTDPNNQKNFALRGICAE
jgi:transmembrane sensor